MLLVTLEHKPSYCKERRENFIAKDMREVAIKIKDAADNDEEIVVLSVYNMSAEESRAMLEAAKYVEKHLGSEEEDDD